MVTTTARATVFATLLTMVLGMAVQPAVQAADLRSKSCKKAGVTSVISGRRVICTMTPKGLVWVKRAGAPGSSVGDAGWKPTADGWQPSGKPPACPQPLAITAPVDIAKATSVLYPGQTRGGDYKPHGGLRFDENTSNDVTVKVPMSGTVVAGARYLELGDVQYMFDIMSPCGIMNRLDHLLVLSPKFQAIADKLPAPIKDDSRTTFVSPPVNVQAGDVIATAVGLTAKGRNVFLDWGVYDYRAKNAISSNAQWAAQHSSDMALAGHALCWLNLLGAVEQAKVKALPPGDPTSGRSSDYCG